MDFLVFKDMLFDLINESDQFDLEDITSIEKENRFRVVLQGGTVINISLQQKHNDGTYGDAIAISDYITALRFGDLQQNVIDNGTYYSITLDKSALTDNGAEISIPMMHFTVKTSSELENDDQYYGNYRVPTLGYPLNHLLATTRIVLHTSGLVGTPFLPNNTPM